MSVDSAPEVCGTSCADALFTTTEGQAAQLTSHEAYFIVLGVENLVMQLNF